MQELYESTSAPSSLQRHFGFLHATALNITMIVGAGVFVAVPLMLKELPGPYALFGWVFAGVVMLADGLIWSELGSSLPGSGGSYLYLLEGYGRERWGRLMAFLFIWQFLISGPLEIGSGLIAIAQFSCSLSPGFKQMNDQWTRTIELWKSEEISISFGPSRLLALVLGILMLVLLYRRITTLGRLTVALWIGVLFAIVWILLEGIRHFDWLTAFDSSAWGLGGFPDVGNRLGAAMRVAMYSYLGYYSICYIGDEVRDPGRTIPRSIIASAGLVCLLFIAVHLAMLGTISWREVPTDDAALASYSLPASFMERIHGSWAVTAVTLLLVWTCFGSAFAGLLGYSRIPYGAARYGHFFPVLGKVHPRHRIPHVALLFVGGLTLLWSLFSLQSVIDALITTRIIEQFIGQIFAVVLLRRSQPDRPRPYKIWLYPLPCAVALVGWLFMYATARPLFIWLGLGTLFVGAGVFLLWARHTRQWPFGAVVDGRK
jgi:amino acid transporter